MDGRDPGTLTTEHPYRRYRRFLVCKSNCSAQTRWPEGRADEKRLVAGMIKVAHEHWRYAYLRIAALLKA